MSFHLRLFSGLLRHLHYRRIGVYLSLECVDFEILKYPVQFFSIPDFSCLCQKNILKGNVFLKKTNQCKINNCTKTVKIANSSHKSTIITQTTGDLVSFLSWQILSRIFFFSLLSLNSFINSSIQIVNQTAKTSGHYLLVISHKITKCFNFLHSSNFSRKFIAMKIQLKVIRI